MYESNRDYVNRYGDTYSFVPAGDGPVDLYQFMMEGDSMKFARFGGIEGQDEIDTNNLGMFDPSGGPYIALGERLDGKPITRIFTIKEDVFVELQEVDDAGN